MLTTNFQTTVLQCSKNYGSLTRVTRLKVVPKWQTQSVLRKIDRSLKHVKRERLLTFPTQIKRLCL